MKNLFPGFYPLSEDDFKTLWKNGTFVLDTNVMLNLYRYPKEAVDDLFGIFESLAGRIWVPFHAALEYQRNRLSVIAEQKKRFQEVKNVVSNITSKLEGEFGRLQLSDRHALIDPNSFLKDIRDITDKFQKELVELERRQRNVNDEDPLRSRIDKLLSNKVGTSPTQKEIEDITKEGLARFEAGVPPGFMDTKKNKDPSGIYSYGGISYEAQYGDLILWVQLIEHAKKEKLKSIIFITDDEKEDWWWKLESEGEKKLGPRPELVEEIKRKAGVESFYMYNTEVFLKYAQQFLNYKVNKETIAQVREAKNSATHRDSFMRWINFSEGAIGEWLRAQYPTAQVKYEGGWPDFKVYSKETGQVLGFEVIPTLGGVAPRLRDKLYRAYHDVKEGKIEHIEFIVVFRENEDLKLRQDMEIPAGVSISYGTVIGDSEKGTEAKYIKIGDYKPDTSGT